VDNASGGNYVNSSYPSVSESALYGSFCNSQVTVQELSFPPGVCLIILFPFQFRFPFPFTFSIAVPIPLPVTSTVPFHLPVRFSQPCVLLVSSQFSMSLPSLGQLLPLLWAGRSAQLTSSLFSSIISSQLTALGVRTWPELYCRQHGGSNLAECSSWWYPEQHFAQTSTIHVLVVWRLEQSWSSPKGRVLFYLQLFSWLRWLLNSCPLYERRLPTTPVKANTCSSGAASLADIVKVARCDWIKKDYII